ncbi:hypothetical protein, partial [Ottowia sp.]|uniref:hypothetical protein n=1 Tax=Ottowia sp. TaxID=1898956 RepID=UPI0039E54C48
GQRLMEYTGRATLQGAIQAVVGGKFKDGFVNSLMASVAGEVSGMLNAEIAEMSRSGSLNESQASTMRLLARATGSALRVVANPGDPAAGFAGDFLGGVLGDAVGISGRSAVSTLKCNTLTEGTARIWERDTSSCNQKRG